MESVLHALVVEDSEEDALLLVRHLSRAGYRADWRRVDTPRAFSTALEHKAWDIIFADYSMPGFSGTHALTLVRERGLDTPFIFVSGTIGEETAVEAMRLGAHDYVMKDNLARLLPAVERELREAALRHEQRRAEGELQLLQAVATAAATAADVPAALAMILGKICEAAGWVLAQAWVPRADGAAIECSSAWHGHGSGLEGFRAASVGLAFAPGEGLPGRVWSLRRPVWVPDVTQDRHFKRAALARAAGLKTGLGMPVLADDEVLAVLEFFLREPRAEDARLLKLLHTLGEQLSSVIQRKRAQERLHYLAHYDALTALPNRVLFMDRLTQALHEANRHKRLVGVALLDLDRFKTINDSLGHGIGDLLIKSTAERLARGVREGDTVARLAGDEFTLVLADLGHADHAVQIAKKILNSLAQPFYIAGHEIFTSASLGMTLYPSDDNGVEGLLCNADIAMYRAKESGGNIYAFYSADMMVKAHERLALENDLRRALEHKEFVLHYQPMINLGTGKVTALEALIRWQHPRRGLVPPDEFIPVAEEAGLIMPLGEWVLYTLGEQHHAYRALQPVVRLAANISARQFQQPDLPETILAILRRSGFNPELLELEITESLLMQNMETALALMRRLADHGVRFSVDDFGTGYSSLAYLKRLPISGVKIDRSFVSDIPANPNSGPIVSAIISMAHHLGLEVTAEGVETAAQVEFLRERGCDTVQGYYYARPLPAAEIARRLAQDVPFP